ncbi:MAG: PAS domain-containing protein [Deltaproteobacteria bacterium]|nr:PAS domain-containing protein [Deltaproteobacteria bacterium]
MTADARASAGDRRLHWAMLLRLAVVCALLGGTIVSSLSANRSLDSFTPRLLVWSIVATFVLALASAPLLVAGSPRTLRVTTAVQIAWDLLLATGLVYVSGGAGSGFVFVYGLSVLAAALLLGPKASYVTLAAALILFGVMTLLLSESVLPPPPDQSDTSYQLATGDIVYSLLSTSLALSLVALLSSTLASRLSRAGGALREAERARADITALHRDTIHSLGSGLLTTDLDGIVQSCNPAGLEILGRKANAVVGVPLAELLPDAMESSDPAVRADTTIVTPTGVRVPVGFTRRPLRDAAGKEHGALVAFQDLTELVRLRELAERAQHLAVLGRLAAGLAHEIRNPLGSISGAVQLVREAEGIDDEDKRLLGIVLKETARLNELVTTMLDLSRPRPPERVIFDLAALARDVVEVARQGSTARIDTEGERDVEAFGDPGQIRQVVWNLVKNAVQSSGEDGRVVVRVTSSAEGAAVLEVLDDGPGIPESERGRIFDAFYSTRTHGVGIGLALVRQIAESHAATLSVDSGPLGGATFRLELPPRGQPSRPSVSQTAH